MGAAFFCSVVFAIVFQEDHALGKTMLVLGVLQLIRATGQMVCTETVFSCLASNRHQQSCRYGCRTFTARFLSLHWSFLLSAYVPSIIRLRFMYITAWLPDQRVLFPHNLLRDCVVDGSVACAVLVDASVYRTYTEVMCAP